MGYFLQGGSKSSAEMGCISLPSVMACAAVSHPYQRWLGEMDPAWTPSACPLYPIFPSVTVWLHLSPSKAWLLQTSIITSWEEQEMAGKCGLLPGNSVLLQKYGIYFEGDTKHVEGGLVRLLAPVLYRLWHLGNLLVNQVKNNNKTRTDAYFKNWKKRNIFSWSAHRNPESDRL